VGDEPDAGRCRNLLQRARLVDQVSGTGDHGDPDPAFGRNRILCPSTQAEDRLVASADGQRRRLAGTGQRVTSEIQPADA
jgi:hypothetical protein